jgi:predicted glycoside hydrolase/deacetylase ChbG (UPF0249 family)
MFMGHRAVMRAEQPPFQQRHDLMDVRHPKGAAIRAEIVHQLETFQWLMGSDPTHIDSHQHVHHHESIEEVVAEIGNRLGVRSGSRVTDQVSWASSMDKVGTGVALTTRSPWSI